MYPSPIALGSHAELETCVEIACRLGYLSAATKRALFDVSDSTGRLLNGLLRSLELKQSQEKRKQS